MRMTLTIAALIAVIGPVFPVQAADKIYTLQDAYESALGTNEVVKIAEENVIQSQTILDQAWGHVYPTVTAQSGFTRYNEKLPAGEDTFTFQPLNQFQAAVVLRQPLYTGGRTMSALRIAKTLGQSSTSGLDAAKQGILLNAAEAYYAVVKSQKLVDVSTKSLERTEKHRKVTEREAATRKTKANLSALLRAKTLVSQARINIVRAEEAVKRARERLKLVANVPTDAILVEPEALEKPQTGLDHLKETAVATRPDYAAALQNMKIAEENVTIVAGAHRPQLAAEAALQYQSSHPETIIKGTIYYGALRLQVPIFEGGLSKSETAEARSKARQAELSAALLKRSIENEVYDSYTSLETVNSVLETVTSQFGFARDNYNAVEGLYSEGLLTSLSVIDAEQALLRTELELINATYDKQLEILRLKKSIGTLGKY